MSTYSVYEENGGNSDGCVTHPISTGVSLEEALDVWERQVGAIKENGTDFISRPIYMGHGRFREEGTSNWHHVYFTEDEDVIATIDEMAQYFKERKERMWNSISNRGLFGVSVLGY